MFEQFTVREKKKNMKKYAESSIYLLIILVSKILNFLFYLCMYIIFFFIL